MISPLSLSPVEEVVKRPLHVPVREGQRLPSVHFREGAHRTDRRLPVLRGVDTAALIEYRCLGGEVYVLHLLVRRGRPDRLVPPCPSSKSQF